MAQTNKPSRLAHLLQAGGLIAILLCPATIMAVRSAPEATDKASGTDVDTNGDDSLWSRYNYAGRRALIKADYKHSETFLKLALIEAQKNAKDERPLAATLNNIAELRRLQGRYKEA
jgi:hypothetical protein